MGVNEFLSYLGLRYTDDAVKLAQSLLYDATGKMLTKKEARKIVNEIETAIIDNASKQIEKRMTTKKK